MIHYLQGQRWKSAQTHTHTWNICVCNFTPYVTCAITCKCCHRSCSCCCRCCHHHCQYRCRKINSIFILTKLMNESMNHTDSKEYYTNLNYFNWIACKKIKHWYFYDSLENRTFNLRGMFVLCVCFNQIENICTMYVVENIWLHCFVDMRAHIFYYFIGARWFKCRIKSHVQAHGVLPCRLPKIKAKQGTHEHEQ